MTDWGNQAGNDDAGFFASSKPRNDDAGAGYGFGATRTGLPSRNARMFSTVSRKKMR
jgi:hypothetical protein